MRNCEKIETLSHNVETNSYVVHYRNKITGDDFVVKRILGLDNPLHKLIFDKELQALTKLRQSDNIVTLLNYRYGKNMKGVFEGQIFMEYINGDTLSKCCSEITSITDKFNILKQVVSAIEFSHECGVIHRDINPNNIMLTPDYFVKVIDFGICKIKDMVSKGTTYQFATNKYAAPEVRYHSKNTTEKSDIYSLGAVFYFIFTKKEPPMPEEFEEVIQRTGGIDLALKEIILKMTNCDPSKRYEDLMALETDLAPLYHKYLKNDEKYIISISSSKLDYLKRKNFVHKSKNFDQLMREDLITNFSNAYIRSKEKDGYKLYCFDGQQFSMECDHDPHTGFFQVINFQALPLYVREKNKKTSMYVSGEIKFIPSSYNTSIDNNNYQLITRLEDHLSALKSKKNVDVEFQNNYGFWYDYLKIMEEDAVSKASRFYYSKFLINDGLYFFYLTKESFMSDEELNPNTELIYEQSKSSKPNIIGTFVKYSGDGSVLVVKPTSIGKRPPKCGSLCINYYKKISQFRRQKHALDEFVREEYSSTGNLKSFLVGLEEPTFFKRPGKIKFLNQLLDDTQQLAVTTILESRDIALVQGPPGTGKTNVIIEVIRQIIRKNKWYPQMPEKILLVSQSHAAVDKILEDLDSFLNDVRVIRIGIDDNLTDLVREKYGLDNQRNAWINNILKKSNKDLDESLEKLKIDKEDFIRYSDALECLNLDDTSDEVDRYNLIVQAFLEKYNNVKKSILKILLIQRTWIKQIAETGKIEEYFIKSATVVAGTCSGFSSNPFLNGATFDYVIVDEAAKATLPEILIPMVRAKKVVLVGDHKQLPPMFDEEVINNSSKKIDKTDLKKGGFEKIFNVLPNRSKVALTTQYRMHPVIGDMIAEVFYKEIPIQNGVSISEREINLPSYKHTAMLWLTTSKVNRRKECPVPNENGKRTYMNYYEASVISKQIAKLDNEIKDKEYSVSVITPYRAQVIAIKQELQKLNLKNITPDVNTVDAFQGSQKDIILYSTVRTSTLGFLKEKERINVSFSRATRLLIIVGDSEFLNNRDINKNKFPDIIDYMHRHNDYCKFVETEGVS